MKGSQGRRSPLSGLRGLGDRFSLEALRRRQDEDKERERALSLDRLKAQVAAQRLRAAHRPKINYNPKRGVTKRPMSKVKLERRKANKRAKLARRVNRVR